MRTSQPRPPAALQPRPAPANVNALSQALKPSPPAALMAPQRMEPQIKMPKMARTVPPKPPRIAPARRGRGFNY